MQPTVCESRLPAGVQGMVVGHKKRRHRTVLGKFAAAARVREADPCTIRPPEISRNNACKC
eukprot:5056077-Prymnesium_polylepis.1